MQINLASHKKASRLHRTAVHLIRCDLCSTCVLVNVSHCRSLSCASINGRIDLHGELFTVAVGKIDFTGRRIESKCASPLRLRFIAFSFTLECIPKSSTLLQMAWQRPCIAFKWIVSTGIWISKSEKFQLRN